MANLRFEEGPQGIMIDCGCEAAQDFAYSVNGWTHNGVVLKVQRAKKQMGWKEIFNWVTDELQDDEEFNPYYPPTVAHVQAISGPYQGTPVATTPRPWQPQESGNPNRETGTKGKGFRNASKSGSDSSGGQQMKGKGKKGGKSKGQSVAREKNYRTVTPPPNSPPNSEPQPPVQVPPRETSGKGNRKRRPPPDHCPTCKRAGRASDHDFWRCPHWQAYRDSLKNGAKESGSSSKSVSPPQQSKGKGRVTPSNEAISSNQA